MFVLCIEKETAVTTLQQPIAKDIKWLRIRTALSRFKPEDVKRWCENKIIIKITTVIDLYKTCITPLIYSGMLLMMIHIFLYFYTLTLK